MALRATFWVVIVLALICAFLETLGYHLIQITLLLVLLALAILELIHIEEKESLEDALHRDIASRLESMERVLNYLFKNVSSMLTIEHLQELERRILSSFYIHKKELEEKFKKETDQIARKVLEIENRLSELKSHSSDLAKKLETMENYVFNEEEI